MHTDSRLANLCAREIQACFVAYREQFLAITVRARGRFVEGESKDHLKDSLHRLDLYSTAVTDANRRLRSIGDDRLESEILWVGIKAVFSGLVEDYSDREIAETFFNSLTRRVFSTRGVNQQIEFVAADSSRDGHERGVTTTYELRSWAATVHKILESALPGVTWRGLGRDCHRAEDLLAEQLGPPSVQSIDVLGPVFFRGRAAYVVGRVRDQSGNIPLVLACVRHEDGVVLDAVLTSAAEVAGLFSMTRSAFHAISRTPAPVIAFLQTILPEKSPSELYSAIGYSRHGKTEFHRDLLEHLGRTGQPFEMAPGKPGLVMSVFTIRDFRFVFKVIRDRFPAQKRTTRRNVLDNYRMVSRLDRLGRLIDAHEFEHLRFDVARFDPDLLDVLVGECSSSVVVDDSTVTIRHAYVERRVTPLDIFLQTASDEEARRVVVEYGNAIKDLAASGIFPGDLLIKNFGVTRYGRVVFYDYDELQPMSALTFRPIPEARTDHEEMAAEPWFFVGPNDVFPEEFGRFLGMRDGLRSEFLANHADLLTTELWQGYQRAINGDLPPQVFPYRASSRIVWDDSAPDLQGQLPAADIGEEPTLNERRSNSWKESLSIPERIRTG